MKGNKATKLSNVEQSEAPASTRNVPTLSCKDSHDLADGPVAFETPNYPNNYPNRKRCNWYIDVPSNAPVYMYCDSFDVKRGDSLCVTNWNTGEQDCAYGTVDYGFYFYYGYITSELDNTLHFRFKSNRRKNAGGFRCYLWTDNVVGTTEATEGTEGTEGSTWQSTTVTTTTTGSASSTTAATAGPSTAAPTTASPTTSSSSCNCGVANRGSRIVGGVATEINEYPWQVGLVSSSGITPWCGGSLISNQHVLTAAHCTAGASPSNIRVSLGEHNIADSEATIVSISAITDHPNYNFPFNDYSILTLSSPVTFSDIVRPICLPADVSTTYDNDVATVTGWGTLTSGGSQPSVLQEVNVTVLANAVCKQSYSEITNVHICASSPGKDSCQGDSGGPLFLPENSRYTQVGVVSYGVGCADPSYPGVYARVTAVKSWIQSVASGTQDSNC